MDEPSLLDYLKERLNLRRLLRGEQAAPMAPQVTDTPPETPTVSTRSLAALPWRSLLALLLALAGQRFFEPGASLPKLGIGLYLVAAALLIAALIKREWVLQPLKPSSGSQFITSIRKTPLVILLPLLVITYFSFSGNRFSVLGLILWAATFLTALWAFWQRGNGGFDWSGIKSGAAGFIRGGNLFLRLNGWNLLVLLVLIISAWFHLNQLSAVPLEMTSDHAEKILDVNEVLNGNPSIFFARNSGREPLQFYLTAALVKYFGLPMSFTTLKLGMALAFLLSLYYVYRLGEELGSRWTGLLAMVLVGFASWTNILARSGMRLVLTPVFVAPLLFYLLRGLRQSRRNDLLLAGIFLGLGLLGYSAFRVMPLVILLVFVVFALYQKRREQSEGLAAGLTVLIIFTIIAALPLLRFASQYPELIALRTVTRMTSAEQAIADPVGLVFLRNFWNAILMPFWRNGNTWVISVPGRPALDLVSAALYLLGVGTLVFNWLKQRSWQSLVLLLSIPLMMLPSMLALAFPLENPSLSRAGGAVIPILLTAAIALESLLASLWQVAKGWGGRALVMLLGAGLLLISAQQNYDLVFRQYRLQYQNATWNSSQMGSIARNFIDSIGDPDNVYVVAVAHWVDTRLVAMNAGYVERDYAIWADDLEFTLDKPGTKLFFVKADDVAGMSRLTVLYPDGVGEYHQGLAEGRDFYTYVVPPTAAGNFQK